MFPGSRRCLMAILICVLPFAGPCLAQGGRSDAPPGAGGLSKSEARIRQRCQPPKQPPAGKVLEVFQDCHDTPEMVRLPGGRFLMGQTGAIGLTYELPVHEVEVQPFSIGRYEVTFLQWDVCHAEGFCLRRPDDKSWGRAMRPVINISWVDAQQFVAWLRIRTGRHYRLPSEAEWEYAARAGSATAFHWGESTGSVCKYANVLDVAGRMQRPNWFWSNDCMDGYAHTAPVGSFPANPWGLYDVTGNVWEWVQDCWHSDYTGAPTDGSPWIEGGDCSRRVNRGGGWGNHARTLRSAKRDADMAEGYGDAFGLRVVREDAPGERRASELDAAGQDAGTGGGARVQEPAAR